MVARMPTPISIRALRDLAFFGDFGSRGAGSSATGGEGGTGGSSAIIGRHRDHARASALLADNRTVGGVRLAEAARGQMLVNCRAESAS